MSYLFNNKITTTKDLIKSTKMIQEFFPKSKVTIITKNPDPAKNIEIAKEFGKAGIRGKWRNIKKNA